MKNNQQLHDEILIGVKRSKTLQVVQIIAFIGTIILSFITFWANWIPTLYVIFFVMVGILISFIANRLGHENLSSLTLLVFTLLGVGYITMKFGIADVSTLTYPVLILMGAILLESNHYRIFLFSAVFVFAFTGLSQIENWFGIAINNRTGFDEYLTSLVIISIIVFFANFIFRDLRKSVVKLQDIVKELQFQSKEVRQSESKWKSLISNAPDIIIQTDIKGRILFANRDFIKVTSNTNTSILDYLDESEHKKMKDFLFQAYNQVPLLNLEFNWVFNEEYGRRYSSRISPIVEDRHVTSTLVLIQDITETRQLQDQLIRSQRLESLGNLAGGIAHDFNNLLTVINGQSELLLMNLNKSDQLYHDIHNIHEAGQRGAALTRQILTFSRKQEYKPRKMNFNRLVTDVHKLLHRLIKENFELKMILSPELPDTVADINQVDQIIINLVLNARDAIKSKKPLPSKPLITIETSIAIVDQTQIGPFINLDPGKYINLRISDNGIGMTEEVQNKVFEPFFTTKPLGEGTGLGLSTVYGIVQQHKGAVQIYSEYNKGTSFNVLFPLITDFKDEFHLTKSAMTDLRGNETIVLVEDDDTVREISKKTLESFNYRVFEYEDGQKALDGIIESGLKFDLLISDYIMPGLNGIDLIKALSAKKIVKRVILISGYSYHQISGEITETSGIDFLQKPYAVHELLEKVKQVLST